MAKHPTAGSRPPSRRHGLSCCQSAAWAIALCFTMAASQVQARLLSYEIDGVHSVVGFSVPINGGIGSVEGAFTTIQGTIRVDEATIKLGSIVVEIDASSIDTGNDRRDAHLRSVDFFDTETYPTIRFQSTSVRQDGVNLSITGNLTIRDITRSVSFSAVRTHAEAIVWVFHRPTFAAKANLAVDRSAFGVKANARWNRLVESTGELAMSNHVGIRLHVLAEGPRMDEQLLQVALADGVPASIKAYRQLVASPPRGTEVGEATLNALAYGVLNQSPTASLPLFDFYADQYSSSANAHDSRGSAYYVTGDFAKAAESFRRALDVDPSYANATAARSVLDRIDQKLPLPRDHHAVVFDEGHGTTVLFGGNSDAAGFLADTWVFDHTWKYKTSDGPLPRSSHAMTYDGARGRVLLFGGFRRGAHLGDTWLWNGEIWQAVEGPGPSERYSPAMAYDRKRNRVVLFGGYASGKALSDTWEWDGKQWQQISTDGPPARARAAIAYLPERKSVVLIGGFGGRDAGRLNDVWEWNGTVWQQLPEAPLPMLSGHQATYDETEKHIVVAGGHSDDQVLGSVWSFDGERWKSVPAPLPGPRDVHAMTYDRARAGVLLYAGRDPERKKLSGTWLLQGDKWTQVSK